MRFSRNFTREEALADMLTCAVVGTAADLHAAGRAFSVADGDGFMSPQQAQALCDETAKFGPATIESVCEQGFWERFADPSGLRYRVAHWWLRLRPTQNAPTYVYFVEAGPNGPIKIGYSRDVDARVAALQTGNPNALRVLATIPGGPLLERMIHDRFESLRLSGEWFRRHPALLVFLRELGASVA